MTEISHCTSYNFTSNPIYALIVYGKTSNKPASIDTMLKIVWHNSGNMNIFYIEICSDTKWKTVNWNSIEE